MSDEPETAVAVAQPKYLAAALQAQAGGILPIIPTNLEEAQRYANGLILAGIVPDSFKHSKDVLGPIGSDTLLARQGEVNAPLVLMGVLKAMEVGVGPQTGLAGLLPLNGRFSVWGDLAAALVQHGGQVANQTVVKVGPSFDPDTPPANWPKDYGYEVRYWRKGQADPYIGRFTVRDASRANLWMNTKRQPWIMYPDRMLFNRARAFALRDGFADALAGLSIAEEVLDALPPPVEAGPQGGPSLADDEPVTQIEGPQVEPFDADAHAASLRSNVDEQEDGTQPSLV